MTAFRQGSDGSLGAALVKRGRLATPPAGEPRDGADAALAGAVGTRGRARHGRANLTYHIDNDVLTSSDPLCGCGHPFDWHLEPLPGRCYYPDCDCVAFEDVNRPAPQPVPTQGPDRPEPGAGAVSECPICPEYVVKCVHIDGLILQLADAERHSWASHPRPAKRWGVVSWRDVPEARHCPVCDTWAGEPGPIPARYSDDEDEALEAFHAAERQLLDGAL